MIFVPHALYVGWPRSVEDPFYSELIEQEVDLFCQKQKQQMAKEALRAIYISACSERPVSYVWVLALLKKLHHYFAITDQTEVTLELSLSSLLLLSPVLEKLSVGGVNRVCVSADKRSMAMIQSDDFEGTLAGVCGVMQSVVVDINFSGVEVHFWNGVVNSLVKTPIDGFSISFIQSHGKVVQIGDVLTCIDKVAGEQGFIADEICSYRKITASGSRYMQIYRQGLPLKGFGLGAESFCDSTRMTNVSVLSEYRELLEKGALPYGVIDQLDEADLRIEKIITGLRQKVGVSLEILYQSLSPSGKRTIENRSKVLVKQGLLSSKRGILMLTQAGFLQEEQVVAWLLRD